MVHAGSKDGLIPGADFLLKAKSSSGDYYSEMNNANFVKWLKEKLVVVDCAAYHNIQEDKYPTGSTRKANIKSWLESNHIAFFQGTSQSQSTSWKKRRSSMDMNAFVFPSTMRNSML